MGKTRKAVSKGGPKTAAGKARSSQNATKHGILGAVAPFEAGAYAEHLAAVRADRQPVGYLEEVLCDRVALALWRLGRVATFEAGQTAAWRRVSWKRETSHSDYGPTPPLARIIEQEHPNGDHYPDGMMGGIVEGLRKRVADCKRTEAICTKALEADDLAAAIKRWSPHDCHKVGIEAESYLYDRDIEIPDDLGSDDSWTPRDLIPLLALIGQTERENSTDQTRDGLCELACSLIREWRQAERDAITAEAVAFETVAGAAIPKGDQLEKIAKYEAHLERTLYRAMHELEALQDKRQGKDAPLARMQVHGPAA